MDEELYQYLSMSCLIILLTMWDLPNISYKGMNIQFSPDNFIECFTVRLPSICSIKRLIFVGNRQKIGHFFVQSVEFLRQISY